MYICCLLHWQICKSVICTQETKGGRGHLHLLQFNTVYEMHNSAISLSYTLLYLLTFLLVDS